MQIPDPEKAEFHEMLDRLAAFKWRFGHLSFRSASPLTPEDKELARWVRQKRQWYWSNQLPEYEYIWLCELDVNFESGTRGNDQEIDDKIDLLEKWRAATGKKGLPTRSDPNPEFARLADWIQKTRRYALVGNMSDLSLYYLEQAGITLARNPAKVAATAGQENAAFDRNLAALSAWLDRKMAASGERDIACRERNTDSDAKKCYRFIEHMILKVRQGLLSDTHRNKLLQLAFTMNGKPIRQVLMPGPSRRS